MIKNPIYKPKGKAADYGEYAINIYQGCPNGCEYCYAPMVLRQLKKGEIRGKAVHQGGSK